MTEKRFEIYDEENGYVRDNKTGNSYSACGGGDGFPFVIDEYHKLQKENEELEKENNKIKTLLFQKIKELNDDYQKSAKAGMPTGGIIGELDSFEEICEEMGWLKQTNKINDEKYKCHICKHLHNDETLKLYCDINGVDFLKQYYGCKNFEDYRNFK